MLKSIFNKNKLTIYLAIILVSTLILSSCSQDSKIDYDKAVSKTEFHLDTSCTIDIRGMDEPEAENIIKETFNLCDKYEKSMSRTIEGSDIYKLNNSPINTPISVSKDTLEVIKLALKIGEETEGIFDISVGKLTSLWNITGEKPYLPSKTEIDSLLPSIDYRNIEIKDNKVMLKKENMWLDLGGIAKGYIGDKLVEFMESKGVKSGILNLGGNVISIGKKNEESEWKIGIDAPYSHRTEIIGSLSVSDTTIVTSGTFERFFERDGIKYHHILHPKTGFPVDTDILSVSIKAPKGNSALSDSYSTTCLLLGKEKAMEFMSGKKGFEYCIVDINNNLIQSDNFNLTPIEK